MPVSVFECEERELCLNILDFRILSGPARFKASISASGQDDLQQPVVIRVRNIQMPGIRSGDIFTKELCPGLEESRVWQLLTQDKNIFSALGKVLIEIIGSEVIYRSRDCAMVLKEEGTNLCLSCSTTFGIYLNTVKVKYDAENVDKTNTSKTMEITTNNSNNLTFDLDGGDDNFIKVEMNDQPNVNTTLKFKCDLCGKRFVHETGFASHFKKLHNKGYMRKCLFWG